MTRETETTVLASLALAAQQYADPTPCYDAIKELRPDVDWSDWIALVEASRNSPPSPASSQHSRPSSTDASMPCMGSRSASFTRQTNHEEPA